MEKIEKRLALFFVLSLFISFLVLNFVVNFHPGDYFPRSSYSLFFIIPSILIFILHCISSNIELIRKLFTFLFIFVAIALFCALGVSIAFFNTTSNVTICILFATITYVALSRGWMEKLLTLLFTLCLIFLFHILPFLLSLLGTRLQGDAFFRNSLPIALSFFTLLTITTVNTGVKVKKLKGYIALAVGGFILLIASITLGSVTTFAQVHDMPVFWYLLSLFNSFCCFSFMVFDEKYTGSTFESIKNIFRSGFLSLNSIKQLSILFLIIIPFLVGMLFWVIKTVY